MVVAGGRGELALSQGGGDLRSSVGPFAASLRVLFGAFVQETSAAVFDGAVFGEDFAEGLHDGVGAGEAGGRGGDAEVCETLGLATEPRTVTPGLRPVMGIAGVSHELIRWTARRSDQIAACLTGLEHEYVTAVDDDGEPKFLPVVSERARAKLNQIAARKTRPPKQRTRPLAQLRAWWKTSAILTSGVPADIVNSLLEYVRAAAAPIRARVATVVDVTLAAIDVTATVFPMSDGGRFHRRHLLAEVRRHLALVLRGRRRDPDLDDQIVAAAISTHCLDISEPKTVRGLEPGYRLYTARWALADLPARHRPATAAPGPDRQPPADPGGAFCGASSSTPRWWVDAVVSGVGGRQRRRGSVGALKKTPTTATAMTEAARRVRKGPLCEAEQVQREPIALSPSSSPDLWTSLPGVRADTPVRTSVREPRCPPKFQ
ncbi:relaxase domain-containing protein [Streptomyces sp. NPDC001348]